MLEQVKVICFLGVLFDEKLTWRQHIEGTKDKCTNINNLLRWLSSRDWGASGKSLLNIYKTMMRARIDYRSVAYMSAAESHLKTLDVEQAKGLRICSGHFRPLKLQLCKLRWGKNL